MSAPDPDLSEQFSRDVEKIEAQWQDEVLPELLSLGFFDVDLSTDTNP